MDIEDVKTGCGIVLLITTILVVLIGGLMFGTFAIQSIIEKPACEQLAVNDSIHVYHWDFWNGCLVKTEQGYWMFPEDVTDGTKNLYIK